MNVGKNLMFESSVSYKQLQWIESSGSQWIDLGTYCDAPIYVKAHMSLANYTYQTTPAFIGSGFSAPDGGRCWVCSFPSAKPPFTMNCGMTQNCISTKTFTANEFHDFDIVFEDKNQKAYVDSQLFCSATNAKTTALPSLSTKLLIGRIGFYSNYAGDLDDLILRAKYGCINVKVNGLEFDLVPALDSNGVACMHDNISKTLFYSKGTSQFIAGPEKQMS